MDPNKLFSGNKMRLDKAHIQKILTETVLTLCQTGVPFDAELSVEGLLGITSDKDNVILVNIKEVIRHDMPKDYSKKSTEKRKAQVEGGVLNKRHKEGERRTPHSFVPEGYNSQEDSQDGTGSSLNGTSSLKIPLIPPELHNANVQMRHKHMTDIREKHSEISRILTVSKQGGRPKSANADEIHFSPDGVTLQEAHSNKDGVQRPQSALNLAHEYISPRSLPQGAVFNLPTDMAGPMSSLHSDRPGASPIMMPADLSMHAPSPRPFPSPLANFHGADLPYMMSPAFQQAPTSMPTSQPIGVVLDTNVQPPAPLAVVAGTGVLTAVSSVASQKPKPEYDFLQDLPEGTAVVQPVEIVPEVDIRTLKAQQEKRERQQQAKKERSGEKPGTDKMGRPKKSKEFCRFRCTICNAASSRKFNLQRHVNSHHPTAVNAIVDLTPPKNPRQIRTKMSPSGEMKFNAFDSGTYHMLTPEGVSIDSAMDLSVSPSPDMMAHMDTESMSDITEDLTPPSSVGAAFPERYTPPPIPSGSVLEAPESAKKRFNKGKKSLDSMLFNKFGNYHSFMNSPVTGDVIGGNAEIDDVTDSSGVIGGNAEEKDDVTDTSEFIGGDTAEIDDADDEDASDALVIDTGAAEKQGDVELVLDSGAENGTSEKTNTTEETSGNIASEKHGNNDVNDETNASVADSTETASLNIDPAPESIDDDVHDELNTSNVDYEGEDSFSLDPVSGTMEVVEKRTSGASDASVEKDANANNKNDLALNDLNQSPSADVNGNSKAPKAALPENTPVPSTSETEASPEKTRPSENIDPLDQCSDVEAMLDYADNNEDGDHLDETEDKIENAELTKPKDDELAIKDVSDIDNVETTSKSKDDELSMKDVGDIDNVEITPKSNTVSNVRLTRRSQSSAVENLEDSAESKDSKLSPLSPRKNSPTKAAIREPIKTRTFTRTSSITTRRNSTQKEIETK